MRPLTVLLQCLVLLKVSDPCLIVLLTQPGWTGRPEAELICTLCKPSRGKSTVLVVRQSRSRAPSQNSHVAPRTTSPWLQLTVCAMSRRVPWPSSKQVRMRDFKWWNWLRLMTHSVWPSVTILSSMFVCQLKTHSCCRACAVPCVPQQVEAQVVCDLGAVSVSWESSKGASSYQTIAQGNGGYASTCNSSHTTCLFNDLLCGLNYSITVSALDGTCSSAESSVVELNTGRINI